MKHFLLATVLALSCAVLSLDAQNDVYQSKKEKISSIRSAAKRDSQAIPFLTRYLKDPETDVRNEAVKAIVTVGSQHSLEPLIEATRDKDSDIQIRAVDGLVNFYLPGYVTTGGVTRTFARVSKKLKNTFADRNEDMIGSAVTVRPDVIAAIADVIDGGVSMDSRANAARAAGILRGRAALPALEKSLRSKDTNLIYECLVAIQKIGDIKAGPSVAFLANDFDEDVQATAIETLGLLHTTTAAPDIRQAVNRPRNARVGRVALSALAMLALPEDRDIFLRFKSNKDADLRMAAFEGLGRLRNPEDVPAVQGGFDNERELKPRLAAAFALVYEGKVDTGEFSPLRYLVNGLNLSKGKSSAEAYLQELAKRAEVRKALLPLLANGTKSEKLGLIHALGPNADAETAQAIKALASDPDPEISITATRNQSTAGVQNP